MVLHEMTKQQTDAANFYVGILNEISVRIEILNMAINGRMDLSPPFIREISYLQLRMMCELVAIGCLVAHGDISDTKSSNLQKEFNAEKIISRLDSLHSNFYPHPVRLSKNANSTHMERIESGFLTKLDLINLYRKCGDKLHRGRLKSFKVSSDKMIQADFSDILEWGKKFIVLLEQHHIASLNNLSHFICILKSQDTNNQACVFIAQSPIPE
jgi:hypothetical protein